MSVNGQTLYFSTNDNSVPPGAGGTGDNGGRLPLERCGVPTRGSWTALPRHTACLTAASGDGSLTSRNVDGTPVRRRHPLPAVVQQHDTTCAR